MVGRKCYVIARIDKLNNNLKMKDSDPKRKKQNDDEWRRNCEKNTQALKSKESSLSLLYYLLRV